MVRKCPGLRILKVVSKSLELFNQLQHLFYMLVFSRRYSSTVNLGICASKIAQSFTKILQNWVPSNSLSHWTFLLHCFILFYITLHINNSNQLIVILNVSSRVVPLKVLKVWETSVVRVQT